MHHKPLMIAMVRKKLAVFNIERTLVSAPHPAAHKHGLVEPSIFIIASVSLEIVKRVKAFGNIRDIPLFRYTIEICTLLARGLDRCCHL